MKGRTSQKRQKCAARKHSGKVRISAVAQGLTSQAGLIPVLKYLQRIGFEQAVGETVAPRRGDNADYQPTDVILLTVVGMIGGATSLVKVCAVWSDGVSRKIGGWFKLPVQTTISHIFKEVGERQISQLESLTHKLCGIIWSAWRASCWSATGS
ncbi:MAG: hypothetical protein L0Y39_12590 [Methylococcaceae bacterium]|nr:hypothetical protein [Methylococcaceae bacterium]